MEVYILLYILWIEVIFEIFDEDGVHPYESSSHLVKLDIDNKGNPVGFSRTTAVLSFIVFIIKIGFSFFLW